MINYTAPVRDMRFGPQRPPRQGGDQAPHEALPQEACRSGG